MKRKVFDLPTPIYSKEVNDRKLKSARSINHIVNSAKVTRKARGKSSHARPKLHICASETNCVICRDFINAKR